MRAIEKGEGKALGQVSAKRFFKSSDVCDGCGVKPKRISIFIPAEQIPSANATHFDKQVNTGYFICDSSNKLCQHKQSCCVSCFLSCEGLLTFSAIDRA